MKVQYLSITADKLQEDTLSNTWQICPLMPETHRGKRNKSMTRMMISLRQKRGSD